ncbi:7741_t:CDS:2 [Entrophospora sp. SA101]|nr:7741_t:CDS:2 [Entrophospora sp. SA101]
MANVDVDLESVYQDYLASLQDLTFNSKPIITNLTIIAQENIPAAKAIVKAIEKQIHSCPPEHKLPVLYLLDSISKNVGGPFVHLFSRNLNNIFMETYNSVDQATKLKLEKVLVTWKAGLNGCGPIFSNDVIALIEGTLMKHNQRYNNNRQLRSPIDNTTPITINAATNNLINGNNVGGANGRNYIHINPSFLNGINQNSLTSIKQSPSPSPPPPQIQQQPSQALPQPTTSNQWAVDDNKYANGIPALPTNPIIGYYNTQQQQSPIPLHNQVFIPPPEQQQLLQECQALILLHQQTALTNPSDTNNQNQTIFLQKLCELIQQKPIPSEEIQKIRQLLASTTTQSIATATTLPTTAVTTNNLPALLNNVAPQHLSTPSPPHNVVMSMPQLHQILQQPNTLLTNPVTSASIPVTTSAGVISILYDAFPSQCKQCGIRFAKDSKDGGGKIGKHLDWHFRQNRKIKEKARKAQSRNWFVTEEDFINSRDSDSQNGNTPTFFECDTSNFKLNKRTSGIGDGSGTSRSKKAKIDHNNKNDINNLISESTVIVPLDIQKTNKPCPICKEKFQMFWNDNEEEWMYRNAVEINGVICHATCHSDAIKLNVVS